MAIAIVYLRKCCNCTMSTTFSAFVKKIINKKEILEQKKLIFNLDVIMRYVPSNYALSLISLKSCEEWNCRN